MYGKTAKTAHYLPRTGSYSTVPHRNGRVDVLPPGASLPTFDDFQEQLKIAEARFAELIRQRDLISAEISAEGKRWNAKWLAESKKRYIKPSENPLPALQERKKEICFELDRINATKSDIKRMIARLQAPARQKAAMHFANVFVDTARLMLPKDVFDKIFEVARDAAGRGADMQQSRNSELLT
jgi:hypothetical protein